MEIQNEKIQLIALEGKDGPVMLRKHYDLLSDFILGIFQHRNQISLTELMELANVKFNPIFSANTGLALLNTKQDLEARRLLKISRQKNRIQIISLKKG
jgi:hypothetical protein